MCLQKKSQENINARLTLVMKSGKFTLGSKTCLKTLRSGKGGLQVKAKQNTRPGCILHWAPVCLRVDPGWAIWLLRTSACAVAVRATLADHHRLGV